jgi:hypothetical protein
MPTDWTITELETWPPQLSASAAAAVPAENDLQRTAVSISIPELPPTGILQALLTVHCTTPNGPRMITVPMSVVWL